MGAPYLPAWYLAHVGRVLDRRDLFPTASHRVIRRVADDIADDVDWLHFYAIQVYGWGGLSLPGLVVAGIAILYGGVGGYTTFLGYVVISGGTWCASAISFIGVIQLHMVLIDKKDSYFSRPRAANLIFLPTFFAITFAVITMLVHP
jgi:hypothetical protein